MGKSNGLYTDYKKEFVTKFENAIGTQAVIPNRPVYKHTISATTMPITTRILRFVNISAC